MRRSREPSRIRAFSGLLAVLLLALPGCARRPVERRPVLDSILGIRIGAPLGDAARRLDALAASPAEPEGKREEESREEGRKMAWSFRETEYASLALSLDRHDRVVWITAFLRPGREVPFSELGDVSIARLTDTSAIWNVGTPEGGYQLVAHGKGKKARVVSLLSFATRAAD